MGSPSQVLANAPQLIADLETLGAALRDARRSLDITQVEAAQLSNVSPRLWNETERGKRRQLGLETVLRMLNTVGLDLMLATRRGERDNAEHDTL